LTKKPEKSGYFSRPVTIFIASIVFGAISAYLFYNQNPIQSVIVSHIFYPFFTYLLLVQSEFKREDLLVLIKLLFWMTILVFIIDYFTYPNTMFAWDNNSRAERNALGIFFYGQGFTILGALIYLEKYISTNKFKFIIPYIISFVFIVFLTGSRTYLLALSISSIFVIFFTLKNNGSLNKKLFHTLTLCLLLFGGIYYLQEHLSNLIELTRSQLADYSTDVRINSLIYYSTSFQNGFFTQLFGNGFPYPESSLGLKVLSAQRHGFYVSDIGIIGLWTYFGVLSVVAWFLIFYKVFNRKYIEQNIVVIAFFVYILINSFFTKTLFDPGYIIAYIYALYLFVPEVYTKEEIVVEQAQISPYPKSENSIY
jgi:hypothetical protein